MAVTNITGPEISVFPTLSIFGGFLNWGYLNSWMVFVRENRLKMDDDGGYPYFRTPPCLNIDFGLFWRFTIERILQLEDQPICKAALLGFSVRGASWVRPKLEGPQQLDDRGFATSIGAFLCKDRLSWLFHACTLLSTSKCPKLCPKIRSSPPRNLPVSLIFSMSATRRWYPYAPCFDIPSCRDVRVATSQHQSRIAMQFALSHLMENPSLPRRNGTVETPGDASRGTSPDLMLSKSPWDGDFDHWFLARKS